MGARNQLWVFVVAVGVGSPVLATDPPPRTPDAVMAVLKRVWSNDGDEAAKAVLALEADPLALPVLRRARATDPNISHQADLERLTAKAYATREKAMAGHLEQWANDGRLDLLTEVRCLTNGKAADAALSHLIEAGYRLRRAGGDILTRRLPDPPRNFVGGFPADRAAFDAWKSLAVFDAVVTFPEKRERSRLALFGDCVRVPSTRGDKVVVVARSEVQLVPAAGESAWDSSLLFANAPFRFELLRGSVIVVDGDLELDRMSQVHSAVLVVNGDITRENSRPTPDFSKSVVWATGDIRVDQSAPNFASVFFAAGKVANADKLALKGCAEENVKEPPLPVRFLDPAEFGLTLEATKDGMKVAKVSDKTAFAKAGLKAGDVIARVGEVNTATAPAFRRELRRGVIEGAVLIDVVRGKEKLELLVAVPDVPAVAKKKDELKAQPPEKKEK